MKKNTLRSFYLLLVALSCNVTYLCSMTISTTTTTNSCSSTSSSSFSSWWDDDDRSKQNRENAEKLAREKSEALVREKAEVLAREKSELLAREKAEALVRQEETRVREAAEALAREQEAQAREEEYEQGCVLDYWEKIGKFKYAYAQQRRIEEWIHKPCIYVPVERDKFDGIIPDSKIPDHVTQPCIYVPVERDMLDGIILGPNVPDSAPQPCIYVPYRQQVEILMMAGPVVVIGGVLGGVPVVVGGSVPGVIIGGGLAIGWLIKVVIPKIKGLVKEIKKSGGGGGGGGKKPDDEDKKNKKPQIAYVNGKYTNNPKHHQHSKGNISKPPRDGQKALDNSIAVPDKDYRVGVEDGKIVQFNEHLPNEYHGYVVENFNTLDLFRNHDLKLHVINS